MRRRRATDLLEEILVALVALYVVAMVCLFSGCGMRGGGPRSCVPHGLATGAGQNGGGAERTCEVKR